MEQQNQQEQKQVTLDDLNIVQLKAIAENIHMWQICHMVQRFMSRPLGL